MLWQFLHLHSALQALPFFLHVQWLLLHPALQLQHMLAVPDSLGAAAPARALPACWLLAPTRWLLLACVPCCRPQSMPICPSAVINQPCSKCLSFTAHDVGERALNTSSVTYLARFTCWATALGCGMVRSSCSSLVQLKRCTISSHVVTVAGHSGIVSAAWPPGYHVFSASMYQGGLNDVCKGGLNDVWSVGQQHG